MAIKFKAIPYAMYKKLTASGQVSSGAVMLYGYCIVSNSLGGTTVVFKDGSTEIWQDGPDRASHGLPFALVKPLYFPNGLNITVDANISYVTVLYTEVSA